MSSEVPFSGIRCTALHRPLGQVEARPKSAPSGGQQGNVATNGFQAQITTDGTTYSFSVKDTVDACHFALFSDDQGVIYTARPLR